MSRGVVTGGSSLGTNYYRGKRRCGEVSRSEDLDLGSTGHPWTSLLIFLGLSFQGIYHDTNGLDDLEGSPSTDRPGLGCLGAQGQLCPPGWVSGGVGGPVVPLLTPRVGDPQLPAMRAENSWSFKSWSFRKKNRPPQPSLGTSFTSSLLFNLITKCHPNAIYPAFSPEVYLFILHFK